MRIPAYYCDAYAPASEPLLARLAATRARLQRLHLVELLAAAPIDPALLQGLHHDDYLHAFLDGTEPLASRQGIPWSAPVRDATLAMLGGQLQAASHALDYGHIVMNIARGFHHAHPAGGSGFCPINGLALVAHIYPQLRVLVLDCDEHGGNGTEEFAARLPNLFAISIFGTRFGCLGGERSWAFHITQQQGFGAYQQALEQAADLVAAIKPDLVIYQAGVDCHQHDPKSLLKLTTKELFKRDLFVFEMTQRLQLPTLFLVAGGYQQAERVARLNTNTVRAACLAWQRSDAH